MKAPKIAFPLLLTAACQQGSIIEATPCPDEHAELLERIKAGMQHEAFTDKFDYQVGLRIDEYHETLGDVVPNHIEGLTTEEVIEELSPENIQCASRIVSNGRSRMAVLDEDEDTIYIDITNDTYQNYLNSVDEDDYFGQRDSIGEYLVISTHEVTHQLRSRRNHDDPYFDIIDYDHEYHDLAKESACAASNYLFEETHDLVAGIESAARCTWETYRGAYEW